MAKVAATSFQVAAAVAAVVAPVAAAAAVVGHQMAVRYDS